MIKDKISAIWQRLTEPNAAVTEPEERFRARLLLTFMLTLMPAGILGFIIPVLLKPDTFSGQIPLLGTAFVLTFLIVITYLISRSRYYRISFYAALIIGTVGVMMAACVDETPEDVSALYYLLILALITSLLFSIKQAAAFTAVVLSIILTAPLYIPNVTLYNVIVGPFNLTLLASVAYLLIASYRNQLEQRRRQQLTQLLDELSHRADQLEALHEISIDISSHRDITELLQAILARATRLLGVPGGSIFLVNPDGDSLRLTAVHGPGKELEGLVLHRGEGMAGQVLATGQPKIVTAYNQWSERSANIPIDLFGSVIQVPMLAPEQVIGVLGCQEITGVVRDFTKEDIQLLEGLARQGAIALQNAYLLKEEQIARDRAERLQAATQALSSSLVLQEVFENILTELQRVVPYDSASVQQLKGPDCLEIIGGHGFANPEMILGAKFDPTKEDNPNRYVIETRLPYLLEDAPAHYNQFHCGPHAKTIIHSWLGVPLIFGSEIIGMLALDKKEIGFYNQEHARLAAAFAAQAAVAIENARLYEKARRHAFELETLAQISAALRTAKSVPELMPILMQKTVAAVNATYSVLFLVDEETGELVSQLSSPPGIYRSGLRQPPGDGITGYVATTQEVHISEDIIHDPLLSLLPGERACFQNTKSAISVPLQTPDKLIGVMHIGSVEKRKYTEADIRLITAVCNIAANALNRAAVMDTLEERVADRTRKLAEANSRLKELDTLKSKFIADISHELRTPVATLNLYMDLLQRGKPEKKLKYMQILRQKTDQLVRLTDDILNISRLNLYEGNQPFTAVNLNETAAIVVAMYQERAQAADISLSFNPAEQLPPVWAERNQLLQAITNLIDNALNYTPAGFIQITTYLLAKSQQVCLQIQDTGIGIAPEEIPHIFQRFYRGQAVSQSNTSGTGLGLAIVNEIVDLHNGRIIVESELGKGSIFRVCLPAV